MKRVLTKNIPNFVDKHILLKGWVAKVRDHGSLGFLVIRDWFGKVQVVVQGELLSQLKDISVESSIEITGLVKIRDEGTKNINDPLGSYEVVAESLSVFIKSKPLPFPLDGNKDQIDETLRLKYRYIDIRRDKLAQNIKRRADYLQYTTKWFNDNDFTQVQTPLFTVSTPEGAKDYLVPSRLYPGKFFALPQAPQQYKQLLMIGGLHRYFQIAPCFRDEDPRLDRHYGFFYQLDVEFSFITQEEIFEVVENYVTSIVKDLTNKKLKFEKFKRIPYSEALAIYGSDKPDLRYDLQILELNSTEDIYKGIIVIPHKITEKQLEDLHLEAVSYGTYKQTTKLNIKGNILEKISYTELIEGINLYKNTYNIEIDEGAVIYTEGVRVKSQGLLGDARKIVAKSLNLADEQELALAFITDFDMFEWSDKENRWDFMHNPFSWPLGGMDSLKNLRPDKIKAQQYDLACNGFEILSGSIRNHNPEVLIEAFKICGYTEQDARAKFGHMMEAFEYGAPPHGGFAIGIDRFMMILFDEPNIREIYAFPMSSSGTDPMMHSPREVPIKDTNELGISFVDDTTKVLSTITEYSDRLGIKLKVIDKSEQDKYKFKTLTKHLFLIDNKYPNIAVLLSDTNIGYQEAKKLLSTYINSDLTYIPAGDYKKIFGSSIAVHSVPRLYSSSVYTHGGISSNAKEGVYYIVADLGNKVILTESIYMERLINGDLIV